MPWKAPTVHVTTGLLDELDDSELHAVLAHELAHVVHRDAQLMTLVAGPSSYLLAGLRQEVHDADYGEKIWTWIYMIVLAPPAALLLAVSRIVSRNREFAADRAAALLIGSPVRVASALIAVEQRLTLMPTKDLRAVAVRDAFHFVAARPPRWWERPWATHPESTARVERLERLESAVQQGAHLPTSDYSRPIPPET